MTHEKRKQPKKKANFIQRSISTKVAATLFIAILIVFAITGFIIHKYTESLLINEIEENITIQSDAVAELVDNLFFEKATIVEQMGTNQELINFLNSTHSRMEEVANSSDELSSLADELNDLIKTFKL